MLRHAVVRLLAAPLFTAFSVVSLAAGVAVTTAVYSVVDALFATDLGVTDGDRLTFVATPVGSQTRRGSISHPDFDDLRAAQHSYASLSAAVALLPSVAVGGTAELIAVEAVDGAYFTTLGVGASSGRLIHQADDAMAARVAVLSDDLWQTRYGGDASVIGRNIRINGESFEVVGIAPPRFRGLFGIARSTRLWIPLASEPALGRAPSARTRDERRLLPFGRLAPHSTVASASAELGAIAAQLDQSFPQAEPQGRAGSNRRSWAARAITDTGDSGNSNQRVGLMLIGLVGLVLVVACTNLANLVLARGAARQGELAVRMAMGASRGRLIWEQCVESAILAAAGLAVSYLMFQGLAAMMTTDYTFAMGAARATLSIRPDLNAPALGVALTATLLALAVFGLEPAVQLARTLDIRTALAKGASGVRPRVGRQRMVIRWQVAIATGFFIVATMFIRGTLQLARHDTGIAMDPLAVAVLNFQNGTWDEARIRRATDRVLETLHGNHAIDAAAASTGLPFGVPPALEATVAAPDDEQALRRPPISAVAATPALFKALGMTITRGRAFTGADAAGSTPVVILSELTASQMFPSSDAVGRSIAVRRNGRDTLAQVVGITRNTDVLFAHARPRPLVFFPLAQQFDATLTLTARSANGDAAAAVAALRDAIRRADADLTVDTMGTGRATLAGPFELVRSSGLATLYLGLFTLLLSMVGLFGVQANVVAHRTREMGVRMSLGATAAQIKLMVMKDGYRPVLEGLGLGLWGGLAARVLVRAYMDLDVSVIDPWMLVVTPIPLILAAFSACYVPAARAARVDPAIALRAE